MSVDVHNDLALEALQVSRGSFRLELDTRISLQGVTALFGASGSGKSTLLRAIAGLLRPDAGRIQFHDTTWFDAATQLNKPVNARPIGTLFQDSRLFRHRSVAGNLQLALRFARSRPLVGVRTPGYEDVIDALDLSALLKRDTASLSGGEARRVALARTLLARPALLLLDEPLTGLDHERKADILPYLTKVFAEYGLPTLYVSHDIDEVAQLADRMLVLDAGRLRLAGSVAEGGDIPVKRSPSDDRKYRYLELDNHMRVLLVSDVHTDKAAASLNVNVGSFDNPPNRHGLAHFLEHMLFIQTEAYPEPSGFQDFVSANGGSTNAYTALDHTNYFFDVKASAFPEALDRWGHFFISPIISPEYSQREKNAVDSE